MITIKDTNRTPRLTNKFLLDNCSESYQLFNISSEAEYRLVMELNTAFDKTIIIIAHRLSTVVDTDKIYLMKQGHFTEVGTHEELLELNGDYALMFNTQKQLYESHNE
jgi:ABC-type transport system involved in cytochrome bd biosynthesis fused ATPase/permease subunit